MKPWGTSTWTEWIRNIRWRSKILGLTGVLIATNLITAGIYIFMMVSQVRSSQQVLEESMLRSSTANRIQIGSAQRSWYQCLLSSSKNKQTLQDAATSMIQATASLEQHIKNLSALLDNPASDRRVIELRNILYELRPAQLEIVRALRQKKTDLVAEKSQEALQYAYLIEDLAKEMVEGEQARISQKLQETARLGKNNMYAVIVMSAAVVVFGLTLGLYFARTITKPLESLRDDLAEVAKGNLRVHFSVPGSGEIGQLISALQDSLNALAIAQERLMTQDKLASLGALTAGVAHEMRNPMNFIQNFSETNCELAEDLATFFQQLVQREQIEPADLQPALPLIQDLAVALGKIQQHTQRMDKIIHGMLQYSGGVTQEVVTAVDPVLMLEQIVQTVRAQYKVQYPQIDFHLVCDYDPQCPTILALAGDLRNAFQHVLSNAFSAVAEKTKNGAGTRYVPTIQIKLRVQPHQIRVQIEDNGTGIRPELMGKIFTPFFTTKPAGEGTGLGLAIAQDIIMNRHRGHITVESESGRFTAVEISLPRERGQAV